MSINRPKSELPAIKEHAAAEKEAIARLKATEAEKAAAHPHDKGGTHSTPTSPGVGERK